MTVVQELYPGDLDRLAPHLEVAMNAFPCFQEAEIQVESCSIYILYLYHKAVTIALKIFFDKNLNSERGERTDHLHPRPSPHGGTHPPSQHVACCRIWIRNW